jgi:hypothetical protein
MNKNEPTTNLNHLSSFDYINSLVVIRFYYENVT